MVTPSLVNPRLVSYFGTVLTKVHLPSLGPFGGPGSCLLVWQLCRGRWTGPLYLPISAFILLEKELQKGPMWACEARPGPAHIPQKPRPQLTWTEEGVEAGDG